ncbi:MAG: hypothetical protein JHC53_07320, partial [Thermoleophilia bacterium]|nr:hypothetical protein [Thermoleophilia bacterium]
VILRKGQTVRMRASGNGRARMRLALWAPGTASVSTTGAVPTASTRTASRRPRLAYTATRNGRWFVELRGTSGRSAYTLEVTR